MEDKRYSQACENNKQPIIAELMQEFANSSKVLEIGSGTGQHAAWFAAALPRVTWQPTDVIENHLSIKQWVAEAKCENVLVPKPFFVGKDKWTFTNIDAVFTANTAHIMQVEEALLLMHEVSENLQDHGVFCQYGPFKIDGKCTSESNYAFDLSLREQGYGGIRDIKELQQHAQNLTLERKIIMPANNFLLVWRKGSNNSYA